MVNGISHHNSAQQVFCKNLVFRFYMNQLTGQSDNPRLLQRLRSGKTASASDTGQRKKGNSAVTVFLQIFNQLFGRLLGICYHILNASAQSRLNRCLIFLLCCHKISPPDAVSVALIPFCQIPQRFQPCGSGVVFMLTVI